MAARALRGVQRSAESALGGDRRVPPRHLARWGPPSWPTWTAWLRGRGSSDQSKSVHIGERPCLQVDRRPAAGHGCRRLGHSRVRQCSLHCASWPSRQVGAAIIFSSGFAEGGAGRAEQREIARIAADSGMVIEGPNCLGMVNYVEGMALTFVETPAIRLGDSAGHWHRFAERCDGRGGAVMLDGQTPRYLLFRLHRQRSSKRSRGLRRLPAR